MAFDFKKEYKEFYMPKTRVDWRLLLDILLEKLNSYELYRKSKYSSWQKNQRRGDAYSGFYFKNNLILDILQQFYL